MTDELINEMLDKGLIEVAKLSVYQAQRLFQQLEILHYCRAETANKPDAALMWLRLYQKN